MNKPPCCCSTEEAPSGQQPACMALSCPAAELAPQDQAGGRWRQPGSKPVSCTVPPGVGAWWAALGVRAVALDQPQGCGLLQIRQRQIGRRGELGQDPHVRNTAVLGKAVGEDLWSDPGPMCPGLGREAACLQGGPQPNAYDMHDRQPVVVHAALLSGAGPEHARSRLAAGRQAGPRGGAPTGLRAPRPGRAAGPTQEIRRAQSGGVVR
jgi:hypothetical protein